MFGLPVNLAVGQGQRGSLVPLVVRILRGAERGRLGRRVRVAGRRVDPRGRVLPARRGTGRDAREAAGRSGPAGPGEEVGLLRHGLHRLPVRAVPRPDAAGAHVRLGARRRGAGALPAARQDPQLGVRRGRVRGGPGRRLAAALCEVRRGDLSARRRDERDVGPRRGDRRRRRRRASATRTSPSSRAAARAQRVLDDIELGAAPRTQRHSRLLLPRSVADVRARAGGELHPEGARGSGRSRRARAQRVDARPLAARPAPPRPSFILLGVVVRRRTPERAPRSRAAAAAKPAARPKRWTRRTSRRARRRAAGGRPP